MPAAQLEHHLLARLVFDRAQFLQHDQPAGFELVGGKMRAAQQVGEDRERRRQVLGQRGAAEAGVAVGNRFAALDAQVVQVVNELPAVARARAAQRHLAGERAEPQRSAGSSAQPAGTRNVNAADSSDIIGSATSTRPLA